METGWLPTRFLLSWPCIELKVVFKWQHCSAEATYSTNWMKWSAVYSLHVQVTFKKPHFSVSFFFISLLMLPDWHILPRSSPLSATLLSRLSLKLRNTDFRQISVVHGDKKIFPHAAVSLLPLSPHLLSRSMTANGVPRHALCVFAPEGVYPAMLTPAPLSPVKGPRACSPQLESAAPSVVVMEVRVIWLIWIYRFQIQLLSNGLLSNCFAYFFIN